MTPEDLHGKLQSKINSLLSKQRKERYQLREDAKNYATDSEWNQNYYFSFQDAWEQECMQQVIDIDKLIEKNDRLRRKFIELKHQPKPQRDKDL